MAESGGGHSPKRTFVDPFPRPDAGSLRAGDDQIDERSDGVHLSYDMMASAPYGSPKAIAQDLNEKLKAPLEAAAN